MIKEILSDIFLLEIPLPGNPLKLLNSYLIKGRKRNLLIDTGFNRAECMQAQLTCLKALKIDWSDIDFFVTHFHGDHSGLVFALAHAKSRTYCSRIDADIIRTTLSSNYWGKTDSFYISHGYPVEWLAEQRNTLTNYFSGDEIKFAYVNEGDVLEYGKYHLTCINTPGHTPGHMCLYEPEEKFLLGGDLLLANISSNIAARHNVNDALGDYLRSLEKIEAMEINMIMPGHRTLIFNPRQRIIELKNHHRYRLDEVLIILRQGAMNAYQVAARMNWDISDVWERIPRFQQWFATGEAIAHLEHLVNQRLVYKDYRNTCHVYGLADR